METNVFLYTTPQWFIFAALISLAYGMIEKKKVFNFIGLGFLLILGIYALYIISAGYFVFYNYLTPEEIFMEELGEEYFQEIPMEAKLLPAYWIFVISGIISIPALFFEWRKKKLARTLMVISAIVALCGFFMIIYTMRA